VDFAPASLLRRADGVGARVDARPQLSASGSQDLRLHNEILFEISESSRGAGYARRSITYSVMAPKAAGMAAAADAENTSILSSRQLRRPGPASSISAGRTLYHAITFRSYDGGMLGGSEESSAQRLRLNPAVRAYSDTGRRSSLADGYSPFGRRSSYLPTEYLRSRTGASDA